MGEVIKQIRFACPSCTTALPDFSVKCPSCNLDLIATDPRKPEVVAKSINKNEQSVFFYVSPLKLMVMFVATSGIYSLFWFYKNWTYIHEHTNKPTVPPAFEAIFGRITYFWLLKDVARAGEQMDIPFTLPSFFLAIGFFLFSALSNVPIIGIFGLCLSAAMLLPVQFYINSLNSNSPTPINSRFTIINWVFIVILGAFQLLRLISDFFPHK